MGCGEMIELPSLRQYQIDNVQAVQAALLKDRRVIDCMPTGAGKSTVAKYILGAKLNRAPSSAQSGNAVFAVHRRGLVDNAIQTFLREPVLPHGVIMSGRDTALGRKIQIASIDTMLAWYLDGGYKPDHTYDLVVFDECHAHSQKLQKWIEAHDIKRNELGLHPAYVLGLSATPMAKGLASVYKSIVKGPTTQWLIDNNYLVSFRYFQAKHLGKLDLLKASGDSFTAVSLEAAFDGLAGDLVNDWKEIAVGRPTVGFFSRITHSEDACRTLNEAGIRSEMVDGDTPDDRRQRLFNGLNNGNYDYLCNVGIVDRGTDIPNIGCIQIATSVNSIQRLIQMLGRGARKPDDSKQDCVVIDHGGSIARLNTFFEDDIDWLLTAEKTKDLESTGKPVISCPQCGVQYRGGYCFACGYEPTKKERKSLGMEFFAVELVEIKKKPKAEKMSNDDIWRQTLFMAGRSNRTYKQAVGIARSKAEKQGQKFRVPARLDVGGKTIVAIPFGDPEGNRRVAILYDGIFS